MAMKSMAKNQKEVALESKAPYYPSLTLDVKQMPELKGADIDDKVMILINAKVSGINKYGNGEHSVSLQMIEGDIVSEAEAEDIEEEE